MKKNKKGDYRGMTKRDISGCNNPNWKGGESLRNDGYLLVRIGIISNKKHGKRYDLKHRLIMEKHLGRKLKAKEIVHHINENKLDNRIENLEVLSHNDHIKIHKLPYLTGQIKNSYAHKRLLA